MLSIQGGSLFELSKKIINRFQFLRNSLKGLNRLDSKFHWLGPKRWGTGWFTWIGANLASGRYFKERRPLKQPRKKALLINSKNFGEAGVKAGKNQREGNH